MEQLDRNIRVKLDERNIELGQVMVALNESLADSRGDLERQQHNQSETIRSVNNAEGELHGVKEHVIKVLKGQSAAEFREVDTREGLVRRHEMTLNIRKEMRELLHAVLDGRPS